MTFLLASPIPGTGDRSPDLAFVKRILLIEDDAGAQVLCRSRLMDLGFEVVVSSNGAMGLMEARASAFDLFLVDIGLGSGIDGYEVCRRLKTIPELRSIPVVLISGQVKTQEDLHRGYEAGCQSFLVKGDLVLLEDVVRAMLRIKALQDELALQNRLLDDQNRRLQAEKARSADLELALRSRGTRPPRELSPWPVGLMVVGEDGVVHWSDRGAHELLGQAIDGKHLASVSPVSRLEAIVRDARTEPRRAVRVDLPERAGRPAYALSAGVVPLVPRPERTESAPHAVLLFEPARAGEAPGPERASAHDAALIEAVREHFQPAAFLGTSSFAKALRPQLARLGARGDSAVVVHGPDGSGKELVASILHFAGLRSGAFIAVDCATLVAENLAEELFGAAGAESEAAGALHRAQRGTLYLRSIEALPSALQERLLAMLEKESPDVRVVVGTAADLARAVDQGRFLPELHRRLSADRITLVPLAGRREDIRTLAQHFLERYARFEGGSLSREALALLEHHPWPGNVDELRSAMSHACERARGAQIVPGDLPAAVNDGQAAHSVGEGVTPALRGGAHRAVSLRMVFFEDLQGSARLLEEYEKRALLHALYETDGDKQAAARLIGIGKSTFYRKLKTHGIT